MFYSSRDMQPMLEGDVRAADARHIRLPHAHPPSTANTARARSLHLAHATDATAFNAVAVATSAFNVAAAPNASGVVAATNVSGACACNGPGTESVGNVDGGSGMPTRQQEAQAPRGPGPTITSTPGAMLGVGAESATGNCALRTWDAMDVDGDGDASGACDLRSAADRDADWDSEGEQAHAWEHQLCTNQLFDFTDVNLGEKRLMLRWTRYQLSHLFKYSPTTSHPITRARYIARGRGWGPRPFHQG